jgi:type II secretory pathway pseudopilin PulG
LLELLVVMLVIVVLAGILFQAGRALQERAKVQQAKADIARLVMALERYYADHGRYPPGGSPAIANTSLDTRDFEVGFGWTEGGGFGGKHLWAYLDEDCTYRRDRRAYISGWPKDRLGSIGVRDSASKSLPYVLRYYKDPWGNGYWYTTDSSKALEDRGAYTLKSLGPNGVDDGDINNIGR